MGERERRVLGRRLPVEEARLHARHVELRALGLAAPRPRHERAVAGADQLLELRLGVAEGARGGVGGLGAELVRLVLGDARQPQVRALRQRGVERLRLHVQVVRVRVVEARRHVLPVVAQRGRELLLGGDGHQRLGGNQVEQLAEAVHREHVGHVRPLLRLGGRGDLGELAVLRRQLGGRRDLHAVGLLERALGEGREPGEALDLHVEELAAHGALLGGGIDVEDVPADRELPALLHLVDPLVAAGHELVAGLLEVEQAALLDLEPARAEVGIGDLLGHRDRGRDEHRGLLPEQRVERGDAKAHEVRRRGEVRLVAHAARGVEAHRPRRQERLQVGGEVAGGAVVARHHERGPLRLGVDQRREQVRAQARRHERPLRLLAGGVGEAGDGVVVVGVCEKASEHALRPARRNRGAVEVLFRS